MFQRALSGSVIYSIASVSIARFWCSRIQGDRLDVNGDGSVGKEEFEQVMKENGQEFNQDQTELFKRKFEQDENKQVTYEGKRVWMFLFRSNEFLLL